MLHFRQGCFKSYNAMFGRWYFGICNFLLGDESVYLLNNVIDIAVLGCMENRRDGKL